MNLEEAARDFIRKYKAKQNDYVNFVDARDNLHKFKTDHMAAHQYNSAIGSYNESNNAYNVSFQRFLCALEDHFRDESETDWLVE